MNGVGATTAIYQWTGIQQQQARAADETDRPWGEAVKAVVEPNAGFKIDPAEIITFCRETLGGVKTPKTVEVWDLLPRNANGKVLKRQIRDQFWLGRRRAV
ncbi:AMP-binding enzyme [Bradyrhizobium sp.]|uniref:AMP-binding enzyme n=1 Tax=Bradyrhizobium sp. TaxID=376 RepID=UPI003BB05E6C